VKYCISLLLCLLQLLRLLLGGNGCVSRRGDWWERLAINLEHQGLAEQALEVRHTQQQQQQQQANVSLQSVGGSSSSSRCISSSNRGWR
jgi:hypothetical protein